MRLLRISRFKEVLGALFSPRWAVGEHLRLGVSSTLRTPGEKSGCLDSAGFMGSCLVLATCLLFTYLALSASSLSTALGFRAPFSACRRKYSGPLFNIRKGITEVSGAPIPADCNVPTDMVTSCAARLAAVTSLHISRCPCHFFSQSCSNAERMINLLVPIRSVTASHTHKATGSHTARGGVSLYTKCTLLLLPPAALSQSFPQSPLQNLKLPPTPSGSCWHRDH